MSFLFSRVCGSVWIAWRCDQLAGLCMVSAWGLLKLHGSAAWCCGGNLFWRVCTCFLGVTCFLGSSVLENILCSRGSPGVLWGGGGGKTSERRWARKRDLAGARGGGGTTTGGQLSGAHSVQVNLQTPQNRFPPQHHTAEPCSFKRPHADTMQSPASWSHLHAIRSYHRRVRRETTY